MNKIDILLNIFSSGRRETRAYIMEERLRAQKYSREMNEKATSVPPFESSSENIDFDDDSEDDFLEIEDDEDDVRSTDIFLKNPPLYRFFIKKTKYSY